MSSTIQHISYAFPSKEYSHQDYLKDFPEEVSNKSLEKLGIKNRYIVGENQLASDLAVEAAEKLFLESNLNKSDIDFVLFCAQEFDFYTPTTACLIQDRLGLSTNAGALDFNLGCTGFVYGLSMAKGLIESDQAKNVLLLTASTLTKSFHPRDKNSRFIFGDGAAATVISATNGKGVQKTIFGTDGSQFDNIIVKDGGARNQISEVSFEDKVTEYGNVYSDGNFFMDGSAVFHFTLKRVPQLIADVLEKNELEMNDIDGFVFHQPNEFVLHTLRKKLNIPEEKFVVFMENCGNTVSSTIPIALHNAMQSGQVKKGDKILLAAFGVGMSWAGTVLTL